MLIPCQDIRTLARKDQELISSVAQQGYDETCPVKIIEYNQMFLIFDGHHRTSAAIKNDMALIPVEKEPMSENGKKKYLESNTYKSMVYDWEDYHGFNFNIAYIENIPGKRMNIYRTKSIDL